MPNFSVIIPARFDSSRLPGKVLLNIANKPMLQHVYERSKASGAKEVIIATDDKRVATAAENFGATVCMTSTEHQNGTARIAEAAEKLEFKDDTIIVNVQGDEPLISPLNIEQAALNLAAHKEASVATLCEPIKTIEQLFNPNITKVVMDVSGYALYFSRAPIPWDREQFLLPKDKISLAANCFYRHIGLYTYRIGFLKQYKNWQSCEIENLERLEQLRMLAHGAKIHVACAKEPSMIGVDTEEDLAIVAKLLPNSALIPDKQ